MVFEKYNRVKVMAGWHNKSRQIMIYIYNRQMDFWCWQFALWKNLVLDDQQIFIVDSFA